jgi:hypothetical protein
MKIDDPSIIISVWDDVKQKSRYFPTEAATDKLIIISIHKEPDPAARKPTSSKHPPGVFFMQLVGDAFVGEPNEFSKRRVRAAGSARQDWNEARQRREGMSINRPQIDGLRRMAGRATHPQKPMPCLESTADCRREQHRHPLGLSFIPRRDQAAGIFEDLRLGCTLCGRFLLGGCGALCLHLATIESHPPIVVE